MTTKNAPAAVADICDTPVTRVDVKDGALRAFNGRSKVGTVGGRGLTLAALMSVAAAVSKALPTTLDLLFDRAEEHLDLAEAVRGSIVPLDYRLRYGADQNCGDRMALALTAAVTKPEGVDMAAVAEIAAANGATEKHDRWLDKGLNNGQVRMNLGNVLRGKVRRGEPVVVLGEVFA